MTLSTLSDSRVVHVIAVVLIALALWAGVTRQEIETKYAAYDDPGDAYSEQIVRNTVVNRILGVENHTGSLIWTKGYGSNDIAYYPDGTHRYHSNMGLQTALFGQIANGLGQWFEADPDRTFAIFRFVNCLLLTTCFAVFFHILRPTGPGALIATLVMSISSGAALFGANLYFMYWLMFTPLLAAPLLAHGRDKAYVAAAIVASLAYFAVRYEFATTFALMWLLPVALIASRQPRRAIGVGIGAFAGICVGFVIVVLAHHVRVAAVEGVSITDASAFIFEKLRLRVASTENVPSPLSSAFVKNILFRWSEAAFAVVDVFSSSRIILVAVLCWFCIRDRANSWLPVYVWAIFAYASWYVFGYQHIMQHYKYDALLFTCTISLTVVARILTFPTFFSKLPRRRQNEHVTDTVN